MSLKHVPDPWYDLSGRLSAAHAVIAAIDYYRSAFGTGITDKRIDAMNDIAWATYELLTLCKADCEELQKAPLEIPDPPPAG